MNSEIFCRTSLSQRTSPARRSGLLLTGLLVLLAGVAGCGGDAKPVVADATASSDDVADDVADELVDGLVDDTTLDDTGAITPCSAVAECIGATPRCDLSAGVCVACLLDHHCSKGEVCLHQKCDAATACKSDKACLDVNGVCDKTAGQCVECGTNDDCDATYVCRKNHCLPKPKDCVSSKDCSDLGGVCNKAKGYCVDCTEDLDCTATEFCSEELCLGDVCAAGDAVCANPTALSVCKDNGSDWVEKACDTGTACADGTCQKVICEPDAERCEPVSSGGNLGLGGVQTCDKRGVAWSDALACADKETCVDGACLPHTCTPDEQRCAPGFVETCDKSGMARTKSACTATQTCVEASDGSKTAACTEMICKPGGLVCDGVSEATCAADGLSKKATKDCAKLPNGTGSGDIAGTCVAGACQVKACTEGAKSCGATAALVCSKGAWLGSACGAKQTCSAGACVAVSCVPNETWCDLSVIKICNAKGDDAAWLLDCKKQNKGCKAGKCIDLVCQPGKIACSGDDASANTCKVDGSGWVIVPCGEAQICEAGACEKVVCDAGKNFCDGQNVRSCNKLGTKAIKKETCGAGTSCLFGVCEAQICKPAESKCAKNGAVKTCNGNGLIWTPSACPVGQACAAGDCKKNICTAGATFCDGADVMQCDPTGTASSKSATCGTGKICKLGACLTQLCKAGETRCGTGTNAGKVETCALDGLSYLLASCAAKTACDAGACEAVVCSPGIKSCLGSTPTDQPQVCNASGTKQVMGQVCATGQTCSKGACVLTLCKPKESKCDAGGKRQVCGDDLLSWAKNPCSSGTACASGLCKTLICTPNKLFCSAQDVMKCDGSGTAGIKQSSCTSSQVCQSGGCVAKVCSGGQTKCGGDGKLRTCQTDGVGWNDSNCASGQTCAGTTCKKLICTPNQSFCAGQTVMTCDKTGTAAAKKLACASGSICVSGGCKKLICKPGAAVCGTGTEANKVRTCAADGLSWVDSGCGSGKTCDGGACKTVVCVPTKLSCAGKDVLKCNALGTATSKSKTCGAGEGCLKGLCVQLSCTPKGVSCVAGKLRTCNAGGTAYVEKACGGGYVCKVDKCIKQVCNPASKYCTASRIVFCLPDGTGWASKVDCNLSKAACVAGACKPWICTPKSLACKGSQLGTCADDGLSWKLASCSDNNACTPDSCAAAKCVNGASKVCNDGDPCTADSCAKSTGKCVTTPISGACDDGTVCTTGEACSGGKCVAPKQGVVTTYAGSGSTGVMNGDRLNARFYNPTGLTRASDGGFFVSDETKHVVRKISASGQVTTFAGVAGSYGTNDGINGRFRYPSGLAADSQGGVYVADRYNSRIRHVNASGEISTVKTGFYYPQAVELDGAGGLIVANTGRYTVERVDLQTKSKTIVAGVYGGYGSTDGPAAKARFRSIFGVAVGAGGRIYVTDYENSRIRLIHGGIVTTVAGGATGYQDGVGSSARFNHPIQLMLTPSGDLLVLDRGNQRLRRVSALGVVTTLAFSGSPGMLNGSASSAKMYNARGLAMGDKGAIFIADTSNQRIRKFTPATIECGDNNPCTADTCDAKSGACNHKALSAGTTCDDGDSCVLKETCDSKGACVGKAKDCSDGKPCTKDLCASATGSCTNPVHNGSCSDGDACTPGDGCKSGSCVSGLGVIETVIGTGSVGSADGPAKSATLYSPIDVDVDEKGAVWWLDRTTARLRRMATDGTVKTIAGSAAGFAEGPGADAKFNAPEGLAVAKGGIVYVADTVNRRVRRVSPAGLVSTYAGSGASGYTDGPAAQAKFQDITGIDVKTDGDVIVADRSNHRIRSISTNNIVTTLAGSGTPGYLDGPGSSARFYYPRDVAVNAAGDTFVTDYNNYRIRKVAPNGVVTTLAGVGKSGSQDGAASSASFRYLYKLAVMADGGLLVVDYGNGRLRRIFQGNVSTVMFNGSYIDGGLHLARLTTYTRGVAVAPNGQVWLTDYSAQRIRRLTFGKINCDDGSSCTIDACDKTNGCTHSPSKIGQACDDGDVCTSSTTCGASGACSGTTKSCDDGNSCTTDSCDPYLGVCANEMNSLACNDGNACSTGEACYEKTCTAKLPKLTTLAGSSNGYTDGKGAAARFHEPYGMTVVGVDLWVADRRNHRIRRIKPDGTVSTVAGSGSAKFADGIGTSASFSYPTDVAAAPDGSVLVADTSNQRIRRITASGVVTTYAGAGLAGYLDGDLLTAKFNGAAGVAVDGKGQVAVSDTNNQRIRLITSAGKVTTLAGAGVAGFVDGPGSSARFYTPYGIDFAANGDLFVADRANSRVRKVTPAGFVTTIAGSGKTGFVAGPATSAAIGHVDGVTIAPNGTMYLSLSESYRVVRLAKGTVSAFFGDGSKSSVDGVLTKASLARPARVTTDSLGQLFISELTTGRIRKMAFAVQNCDDGSPCTTDSCKSATGECVHVAQVAGTACSDGNGCTLKDACTGSGVCAGSLNTCGDSNVCTTDSCNTLTGACTNAANTKGCDDGDACTTGETCWAKSCQTDVGLVTSIAGSTLGYADGAAASAKFYYPWDVAQAASGTLYIADRNNNRIRALSPTGTVTTVAGSGTSGYLDGSGSSARFTNPTTLHVRADGTLAVFGRGARLRSVAKDGTVGTLAGSGVVGLLDGYATSAKFGGEPGGLAEDGDGLLYIVDVNYHRIRTLNAAKNVATFAGSSAGFADGALTSAKFNSPRDIAVGPSGALFIADSNNRRVRKIQGGQVTTLAGTGTDAFSDGSTATAQLSFPQSVAVDALGRVFVADNSKSQRIRMIFQGKVSTVAGNGVAASTDGFGTGASFKDPQFISLGTDGHIYIAEYATNKVRRLLMPKKICTDGQLCTADACDKISGKCTFTPLPAGAACVDPTKPCLMNMACGAGGCQGGVSNTCDDKNGCTADSCDAKVGCLHKSIVKVGCPSFGGSKILSMANETQLNQWAGTPTQAWKLCYQRSVDGASATTFHQKCGSNKPTFSVIKRAGGQVFGGYTMQPWSGSSYGNGTGAFLFSLTHGEKYANKKSYFGTYRKASYGPTFGGGHDLYIASNMTAGYAKLGHSYQCTGGSYGSSYCKSRLTGSYTFSDVVEIEVFVKQL